MKIRDLEPLAFVAIFVIVVLLCSGCYSQPRYTCNPMLRERIRNFTLQCLIHNESLTNKDADDLARECFEVAVDTYCKHNQFSATRRGYIDWKKDASKPRKQITINVSCDGEECETE